MFILQLVIMLFLVTVHRSSVIKYVSAISLLFLFFKLGKEYQYRYHIQDKAKSGFPRFMCSVNPEQISVTQRHGLESYNFSFSPPVDLVITWVNGSDPSLIEEMNKFQIFKNDAASPNRFRDWGILRYCLRSVEKFINWTRHIYIVTNGQIRFSRSKIPDCTEKCKLSDLNNGICDKECNISNCDWDGEDCKINGTDNRSRIGLRRFGSYTRSLIHVVLLYNKEFGYVHRKVPGHVPYIIDKTLAKELYNRFQKEWEKTSASKVRDPYNIPYPFAYYHYLLRSNLKERRNRRRTPIATTYQNNEDNAYFKTEYLTTLEKSLQRLLVNKNIKFACINDGMIQQENMTAVEICQAVIDTFFKQLVPGPSSFELKGNC